MRVLSRKLSVVIPGTGGHKAPELFWDVGEVRVKEPPGFHGISDPFISHEIFYRDLNTFYKYCLSE